MVESYSRFDSYVQLYGLQRSEGLLLRYLSQVYRTLSRTVPDAAKTDEIHDILAYLRTMIERVDSSLFEEWERQLHPEAGAPPTRRRRRRCRSSTWPSLPKAFRARVRAEMRELVRALSERNYEEAARWVQQDPDDPWDAARFAEALAPFHDEYERVLFDPGARQAHRTAIRQTAPRSLGGPAGAGRPGRRRHLVGAGRDRPERRNLPGSPPGPSQGDRHLTGKAPRRG